MRIGIELYLLINLDFVHLCTGYGLQLYVGRDVSFTLEVMVWDALMYGSRSPFVLLEGKMNAQSYINIFLEPFILTYSQELENSIFQYNIARPHIAKVTMWHWNLLSFVARSVIWFYKELVWDNGQKVRPVTRSTDGLTAPQKRNPKRL